MFDDGPSPEGLAVLRLLLLHPTEFSAFSFTRALQGLPVSTRNERLVYRNLQRLCSHVQEVQQVCDPGGGVWLCVLASCTGEEAFSQNKPHSNGNAAARRLVCRRFESRLADRRPCQKVCRPGVEPPTRPSAAGCITIRPVLVPTVTMLPTA